MDEKTENVKFYFDTAKSAPFCRELSIQLAFLFQTVWPDGWVIFLYLANENFPIAFANVSLKFCQINYPKIAKNF